MASIHRLSINDTNDSILEHIEEDGAVIVDGFLSEDICSSFNSEIDSFIGEESPNKRNPNPVVAAFHGSETTHLTSLAAYSDTFVHQILLHPLYKAVADHLFLPECSDYVLNLGHILQRGQGAGNQMFHRDQDVWPHFLGDIVRNREFASMVALSKYTAEMGATRVVPGSHRWPRERQPEPHEIVIADMPLGSAVIYLGSTLHAAGPNTTHLPRRGMHVSFCLGWLRTQENNCLAVPLERVRHFPRRAQELLGFGLHDGIDKGEGFLGAVNNGNPIDLISDGVL